MRASRKERLEALAQRRQMLVLRAHLQREELSEMLDQLEHKARPLELAWGIYHKIKQHPIMVTVVTALVTKLLLRQSSMLKKIAGYSTRFSILWNMFQKARQAYAHMRAQRS